MSWLRTGPTRELCGKEPSQKKELFRNGGNFTLDRCLSMGDPFSQSLAWGRPFIDKLPVRKVKSRSKSSQTQQLANLLTLQKINV